MPMKKNCDRADNLQRGRAVIPSPAPTINFDDYQPNGLQVDLGGAAEASPPRCPRTLACG
jgi:hypothetical protein